MQNDQVQTVYALSISLALHILFLWALYCIPLRTLCMPQSVNYHIALQFTKVTNTNKERTQDKQSEPLAKKSVKTNKKYIKQDIKKISVKKQTNIASVHHNFKKRKRPSIDKRGLYTNNKRIQKSTGALLDLAGWTWDMIPKPQDTTTETGKIVFEIKVDKYGEIIAIQTMEKTITPLLEKIYADSLSGLTFSKTSPTHVYTNISIGKVTFLIQAK